MAGAVKETVYSIEEAAELLDEIVDRIAEGETIFVDGGQGALVQFVPIEPSPDSITPHP